MRARMQLPLVGARITARLRGWDKVRVRLGLGLGLGLAIGLFF